MYIALDWSGGFHNMCRVHNQYMCTCFTALRWLRSVLMYPCVCGVSVWVSVEALGRVGCHLLCVRWACPTTALSPHNLHCAAAAAARGAPVRRTTRPEPTHWPANWCSSYNYPTSDSTLLEMAAQHHNGTGSGCALICPRSGHYKLLGKLSSP